MWYHEKANLQFFIIFLKAYKYLGYQPGDLPNTEKYSKELFSLPMYPTLTDSEIEYVINTIRKIID